MGPQIPLPAKCYDSHSASISWCICHSLLFVYVHDRPPVTDYCGPLFFWIVYSYMKPIINGKLSHKLWLVNLWLSFIHSSDCILTIKPFGKSSSCPENPHGQGYQTEAHFDSMFWSRVSRYTSRTLSLYTLEYLDRSAFDNLIVFIGQSVCNWQLSRPDPLLWLRVSRLPVALKPFCPTARFDWSFVFVYLFSFFLSLCEDRWDLLSWYDSAIYFHNTYIQYSRLYLYCAAVCTQSIYVSTDGTCPHAGTQPDQIRICDSEVPAFQDQLWQLQKGNNFEAEHEEIQAAFDTIGTGGEVCTYLFMSRSESFLKRKDSDELLCTSQVIACNNCLDWYVWFDG